MTVHKASNTVVTADYDGNVCGWDASTGEGTMFGGKVSFFESSLVFSLLLQLIKIIKI